MTILRGRLLLILALAGVAALVPFVALPPPSRPSPKTDPAAPSASVMPKPAPVAVTPRRIEVPEPVTITSSVIPGMPVHRSVPAPSPPQPAGAAPPPVVSGSTGADPMAEQARRDAEEVRLMLRDFRTRMGGNPVGNNAEIMKAVMGSNPFQARFGPPPGQSLSPDGELMDRWGRPYFFHALSGNSIEIRSAGPDGILWTGDDVVTR